MASIESIDKMLSDAASLLNTAAIEIRDADLNKKENIQCIGTALTYIFEIQHEIYAIRPDLKPEFLKE
jgi:hypothetical protein